MDHGTNWPELGWTALDFLSYFSLWLSCWYLNYLNLPESKMCIITICSAASRMAHLLNSGIFDYFTDENEKYPNGYFTTRQYWNLLSGLSLCLSIQIFHISVNSRFYPLPTFFNSLCKIKFSKFEVWKISQAPIRSPSSGTVTRRETLCWIL